MAKYELLPAVRLWAGPDNVERKVRRIRRLSDGRLGGWIQRQKNLAQSGACWVDDEAVVCDNARVIGDARVYGAASVCGMASIRERAQVGDDAYVCGAAQLTGRARAHDHAAISNTALIADSATICEQARVLSGTVAGASYVAGSAVVSGYVRNAVVRGTITATGHVVGAVVPSGHVVTGMWHVVVTALSAGSLVVTLNNGHREGLRVGDPDEPIVLLGGRAYRYWPGCALYAAGPQDIGIVPDGLMARASREPSELRPDAADKLQRLCAALVEMIPAEEGARAPARPRGGGRAPRRARGR